MTKFRPCIDIHKGKVKQIVGSTLGGEVKVNFESEKSGEDFAENFEKFNLSGGHICVLDKSPESFNLAQSVMEKYKNWQVGGGIDEKSFERFLNIGAEKVIVSSALFQGEDVFEHAKFLSEKIGKENLVIDLSCKNVENFYFVMIHGWRTKTALKVNIKNLEKMSEFASEFLIHGVSVEGKNSGFDEDLVKILTEFKQKNNIPITYAGGIHNLEDIKYFLELSENLLDFTIGSSLEIFGGDLKLEEILEIINKKC